MKKLSFLTPFINIDDVDGILDSFPNKAIFMKDSQSRYIIGNYQYAQKFGFQSGEELKGLTDQDLNPKHMQLYLNDDRAVVKNLRPKNIYNPAYYPTYGDVFVEGHIAPVINKKEKVICVLGIIEVKEHILAGSFLSVLGFIRENNIGKYLSHKQYEIHQLKVKLSKNELVCYFYSQLLNLNSKEVSQLVHLSPRTIEKYIERVRDKRNDLPIQAFNEIIQQLVLHSLS